MLFFLVALEFFKTKKTSIAEKIKVINKINDFLELSLSIINKI
jgi:hypothetical protein